MATPDGPSEVSLPSTPAHRESGSNPSLDETVASDPSDARASIEVDAGTRIGRYVVLQRLGAGAMGLVLAAHDPKLDRRVALKVLKPSRDRDNRASDQLRLEREAQALAKLAHPNVVGVHDVGIHEGRVFLAMEYVQGRTLATHLKQNDSLSWRETIALFLQAGEGLAAAHSAGLVHRDFKPDNAMIDERGRVRVMDFGLARGEGSTANGALDHDADPVSDSISLRLTRTGALMGTPAYMSPEQFVGATADQRSDQFSFCAALYEALYGERPFSGENLGALAMAVTNGDIRPAPRGSTAPAFIRRVLLRGLESKPDQRFPHMRDLLVALARDPAIRRRRVGVGVVLGASLGLGAWGLARPVPSPATAPCAGLDEHLDGIWDDSRRAAVEQALEVASSIGDTASRVVAGSDAWTSAWLDARVEVCQATRVRAEQSAEVMDLRMACLDARLDSFAATVEVLTDADEAVARKAVSLVNGLPGLERCADLDALRSDRPLPDDATRAAAVRRLRGEITRVRTMANAGRSPAASERIVAVVREADELGYAPLLAEVRVAQGTIADKLAKHDEADPLLTEGYRLAMEHRLFELAAEAATSMIYLLDTLGRRDEGRVWGLHAESIARGQRSHRLVARAMIHRGTIEHSAGDAKLAGASYTDALAYVEEHLGPDSPAVASALTGLGNVAMDDGRLEVARDHFARAVAIYESTLGPAHPHVGSLLDNLAATERGLGQLELAREHYTRARGIFERAHGPEHPSTAYAVSGLGDVAISDGDYEAAEQLYAQSLAIREKAYGTESSWIVSPLLSQGIVLRRLGRLDEARAATERALRIREAQLGTEHPLVARTLVELARVADDQGRSDESVAHARRAIAISTESQGAAHPETARARVALAGLLAGAQRLKEARAQLELARPNLTERGDRGRFAFIEAQVLWASAQRSEAIETATRAHAELTQAQLVGEARRVSSWIASRAGG